MAESPTTFASIKITLTLKQTIYGDSESTQPLTLPEIQKKWLRASANEDGDPLSERSFTRYRRDAESLMYVDIECDKSTNLYKVVRPESFKNQDLQDWLLSAFRISSLADRVSRHEDVMIEPAPPAARLLQEVMNAIDKAFPCFLAARCLYKRRTPSFITDRSRTYGRIYRF